MKYEEAYHELQNIVRRMDPKNRHFVTFMHFLLRIYN